MTEINQPPSPELFFETINAYQRTAALKTAIELDLFSALAERQTAPADIAARCGAAERGVRILCDYLTIYGFLTKTETGYGLTPDSATFLDRRSPAYMGGTLEFLHSPTLREGYERLTEAVRRGGTAITDGGTTAPENPVWVRFARGMAPMMQMPAELLVQLVGGGERDRKLRVLDIAAGHGMFGIAFARHFTQAEVVALDWPHVLEVAQENAVRFGVSERYQTLPGSALEIEFGASYDLVLLTNFLHHFDHATCVRLLGKVHAALATGGRAVTLEFVPNEDRVTPPAAAAFSLTMLASTPAGDAYTFPELERMFAEAGFARSEIHPLPPTMEQVVVSFK
ncbi:MAG: methyltransferase [Pyrinomonadaceae bacterium]